MPMTNAGETIAELFSVVMTFFILTVVLIAIFGGDISWIANAFAEIVPYILLILIVVGIGWSLIE